MTNWENLQRLMSELLRTYQEILTLSKQKKDLLVAGKPSDLEMVVKQEEILITRAGKIDVARQQVIQMIIKDDVGESAPLTLSALSGFAPDNVAEDLRGIGHEFERVLAELKEQNILNTQLLKQALNLVNFNLNMFTQSSVGPTYSPSGSHGQSIQRRTMFDKKG